MGDVEGLRVGRSEGLTVGFLLGMSVGVLRRVRRGKWDGGEMETKVAKRRQRQLTQHMRAT